MEYSKAIDVLTECRDIIELSLRLLKSDFSFIDDKNYSGSVLVNEIGDVLPNVNINMKRELDRVIELLGEL